MGGKSVGEEWRRRNREMRRVRSSQRKLVPRDRGAWVGTKPHRCDRDGNVWGRLPSQRQARLPSRTANVRTLPQYGLPRQAQSASGKLRITVDSSTPSGSLVGSGDNNARRLTGASCAPRAENCRDDQSPPIGSSRRGSDVAMQRAEAPMRCALTRGVFDVDRA